MAAVASPRPAGVTHPFTCNTCQVAFRGSELQRGHMQSDWHRYNLKRRVASLPPLTSDIFTEKVLANQASAAATAARASFERICAACQRTYFSENAYQNHLGSQKHRLRVSQLAAGTDAATEDDTASMMSSAFSLGEPTGMKTPTVEDPNSEADFSHVVKRVEEASLEDGDPVDERPARPTHSSTETREEHPISTSPKASTTDATTRDPSAATKCLFCNITSPTLDANVTHMKSIHGMFIPERSYLVDLEGLINYLYDRIHALHECLYCGQVRYTASGVQTHMRDKGHCMIAFESEEEMLEVGEFYDFRGTYSDSESDEEEGGAAIPTSDAPKLGGKRDAAYVDEEMSDDGEGWETDGDEDMSDDETTTTTSARPNRRTSTRTQPAYHDGYELHLPSGRTAGHRSLARYYGQNLANYPTPDERAEQAQHLIADGRANSDDEENSGQAVDGRQRGRDRELRVTRANGGSGMLGVSELKKKEVGRAEVREKKREERVRANVQWAKDKKGNNQKHFRVSLGGGEGVERCANVLARIHCCSSGIARYSAASGISFSTRGFLGWGFSLRR